MMNFTTVLASFLSLVWVAAGTSDVWAQAQAPSAPLLSVPLDEGEGQVARGRGTLQVRGRVVDGFWSRDGDQALLDFNGRTTRVEIPHDERLNLEEAFTISAWVYVIDPNGARGVVSKGRGTYSGYNFSLIHGRPTVDLYLETAQEPEGVRVQGEKVIRPRRWSHVAVAFDGTEGEVEFYHDGEKIAVREVPAGVISYDPPMGDHDYARLPLTISGTAPFPHIHHQMVGFVRHVKVFDRRLGRPEIEREFASSRETSRIQALTRRERVEAGYDSRLALRILDESTAETTCAKVSVSDAEGRHYYPREDFRYGDRRGGHFYSFGSSELKLPSGRYEIAVRKGFEFEPITRQIDLAPEEEQDLELKLDRWVDLPSRGWYCGDEELQAIGHTEKPYDPRLSGDQVEKSWKICMGEGLNWFHFVRGMPQSSARCGPRALAGSGVEAHSRLLGDVIGVNAQSGHSGLFSQLRALDEVAGMKSAATFAEHVRGEVGQPVLKTSPRGLPVAVALDEGNLWRYAFEGDEPIGYRLLNLGFRFASTAGTDTYLNNPASRISPGKYRVYTRLDELNWEAIQRAYRNQEMFVSKGPFVLLGAGKAQPGGTLAVSSGQEIPCRIEAGHYYGLERVELIYNGRTVRAWNFDGKRQTVSLDHRLQVDSPGWMAVRAIGRQGRFFGNWAHTSPIYLQVPGENYPADPDDARFFLDWIDQLDRAILELAERQNWPESDYSAYRSELERARTVYEGFLE